MKKPSNIEIGIEKGLIRLNQDKTRITYCIKQPYTTSFKNPEEKIRATYFCDLVLKYNYLTERIQLEVPIKPDKDRIDLLVYKDDAYKEPYIVVECKREGISDAEFKNAVEQVFRYANYKKAWYAVVVAGNTIESFHVKDFKSGERKDNIISDIPIRYGKPPKYKYYKQEGKDLKIVAREELIKALEKCHNTVWQGGKLAPTTAFDEVSKLLFCKLKDEKATTKNNPYQFQIGSNETPADVFKRIVAIYKMAKQEDEEVFKEDIQLPSEIVFSCIKHLQALAINNIDIDTKGIAFEKFMQDFFKGQMGQFFTPRNIVHFAVEMIKPESHMNVLDPACGSGGFLLQAMDYVRTYAEQNYSKELEIYNHWHDFAKDRLFGIEINDQIARVCKMNGILHDTGHTNIINSDSLKDIKHLQFMGKQLKKNNFDLILTNPPFGATVNGAEKEYLQKYTFGKNRKNQKTEILFIERCVEFLKPGIGQMAIILPDGILNNSSLQYVRDYLLEVCQILAIVSLPQMTFSHYGAGVKSSLLFVRKKGNNEKLENYPIFMAIAEFIGYDATGRETPDQNDLPEILTQYLAFKQNKISVNYEWRNKIFKINKNQIEGRIDSYFYESMFPTNYYKVRNIPNKQLGELIDFSNETWNLKMQQAVKFSYIEIGGICLKTGDIKKISEINIYDVPSRAKRVVREKDIILSTTRPNRGAISLIDNRLEGCIASTGFAVIRKIKVESLDRKYLFYALRFPTTLKQFEQRSTGGNYPTITKKELQKVWIPVPSKETQIQIVALMEQAYDLTKENEIEAERLLNSIDSYVLEQLGIKLAEVKKQKVFKLMSKNIKNQRLDVEYNQFNTLYFHFKKQIKNPIPIKNFIQDYKNGISVGSNQYVSDGIPFVRLSDMTSNNLNKIQQTDKKINKSLFKEFKEKFSPKKGELLYTKVGTVGLCYLVSKEENAIVSGVFLRLICENIELAKFLEIILSLKIYKEIVNKKSSGSVMKHLNLKEFLNLPIPFPDKNEREKIVCEVNKRKAKSQNLKKEATQTLEKTKQKVEDILFKTAK